MIEGWKEYYLAHETSTLMIAGGRHLIDEKEWDNISSYFQSISIQKSTILQLCLFQ
jgi:hypothetical protein